MTIKQSNEQSLGDAIRELIETYKLSSKLNEAKMIGSWEKMVGPMIAKHTVRLNVSKRVLFVELDSAALRNELTYAREKIRKMLNKEAGEELIDRVVFK
jgi:predicted nucleic acid-binding Zn ribbon protein